MAIISPWSLFILPGIVLLRPYIIRLLTGHKFRKFQIVNGCQPVPDVSKDHWLFWNLDIVINDLKLALRGHDLLTEAFVARFRKYGNTLSLSQYGEPVFVMTCEPENVKAILAAKFTDFGVEDERAPFRIVLGASIFTTDGPAWEHARAMFRPQFSRELINDLESSEQACLDLFDAVGPLDPGQWTGSFDLSALFYRFTLDTTTKFLFGESVETQRIATLAAQGRKDLAGKAEEGKMFGEAVQTAQDWIVWRMRIGVTPFKIYCPRRFTRAVETIHKFVGRYVDQALETRRSRPARPKATNPDHGKEKYSLLGVIAEQTQDREDIRDQLMSLLLAGRDTTSVLLSWMFMILAAQPEEFGKLRRAVLQDLGREEDSGALDFARLKSCRYLQYSLNETLRLFAPVPVNVRRATRDTVLPTGGGPDGKSPVALKKGMGVMYSVHAMHVRQDIWGADAVEYKPERWNGRKMGWDYLPFNGGPRVCLGQQYALIEASYLAARLLQRYDAIEMGTYPGKYEPRGLVDGKWDFKKGYGLVQYPLHGVRIKLRRAAA